MKTYIIWERNGKNIVVSDQEIIENALEQEKSGINPHYSFFDCKNGEKITPPGWLVWSSAKYGCGVVCRSDGKMIILTGMQGDFCCC